MKTSRTRVILACAVLAALLALVMLAALSAGSARVGLGAVWDWLSGGADATTGAILGSFRLPRILLAALVGAALSLCGVVFQGILRNPLAEPFILGVSGGAATGAVLALTLGLAGLFTQTGMAFAGALGTTLLVLGLARRQGSMDTNTLVLTGVMINAFFTAVIMYLISTTTDQKLHAIMYWLYGDLGGARLLSSALLAPVVLVCGTCLFFLSRELNLFAAGEEAAGALGVSVERVKLILFGLVSLLAGVTVSLSGLIGFVGLMVPHLVRMLLGHDHRLLLPASALFGASFLVLADTVARLIISPAQLPVGVVTAALGAPFFVLLLARKRARLW